MGHSFGGCLALLVEVMRPGTFAGIFVFEPVICTEQGRARLLAE